MKTQPKVTDLVEVLLTEITELKETIQSTSNFQKKLEVQLEELSRASIHVDTNKIDMKLEEFDNKLSIQFEKIYKHKDQEKKETFLEKSDFKLLVLTLVSTFLFGLSVALVYNQSKRIINLKEQNKALRDDITSNEASSS